MRESRTSLLNTLPRRHKQNVLFFHRIFWVISFSLWLYDSWLIWQSEGRCVLVEWLFTLIWDRSRWSDLRSDDYYSYRCRWYCCFNKSDSAVTACSLQTEARVQMSYSKSHMWKHSGSGWGPLFSRQRNDKCKQKSSCPYALKWAFCECVWYFGAQVGVEEQVGGSFKWGRWWWFYQIKLDR